MNTIESVAAYQQYIRFLRMPSNNKVIIQCKRCRKECQVWRGLTSFERSAYNCYSCVREITDVAYDLMLEVSKVKTP